ncbi:hypothetical protein [Priestia megaterium]|uniref:hypothetical protein n=1 Tax=Priestia megaterium TaxID=1404 RepID=UPI001129153C|nr:hypothetical protein [Priestia megaterium]TPF17940.1 hypothetical protein CBE78_01580 [Priestia megaterium]TPF22048.1 hypothetical protein CBE79_04085 [Priestia megaterium]
MEKQVVNSKIIEIASKNDITKTVTMMVHKNDSVNGNGLDFKQEYVEQFKNTLINKPVVAKYYEEYDDLGDHEPEFDDNGRIVKLNTIAIGTIYESWIDTYNSDDGETYNALYAKADLWNYKYPEIIACVERLYNEGSCDSSVEVEIHQYGENPLPHYRYSTDFTYLANCLLGSSVAPADSDAGVKAINQKEIASAIKNDLKRLEDNPQITDEEGVETMSTVEVFNKGKEVKYHGELEISSLKFEEVANQIYNKLNPINAKTDSRTYKYWIRDLYTDYVIAEEWDDYDTLWKIPYTIANDEVTLASEDQWQKGSLGFIPENSTELNQLIQEKESKVAELNSQLTTLKEELNTMSEQKTTEVAELETKIAELETKVTELSELVVSEKEAKTSIETELNTKVEELEGQITELSKYKEKVEKAEKDAKIAELNSKYSKLLSKETFASEETQKAIEACNVAELNSLVVQEIAKEKVEAEVEINSKDDVTVVASKSEDLLPTDKKSKWHSPSK